MVQHQSKSAASLVFGILLLVVMFAIWTLPPFSIYVQECIPIFKKLWVLYWFLQILFFGIYAFFVMNIDLVKTK